MGTFRIVVVLLLYCLSVQGISQSGSTLDSLLSKVQNARAEDTAHINTLCRICTQYTFSNPAEAIKHAEKGIALAEENNFPLSQANCQFNLGVVYYYQGNYDHSLKSYLKGLQVLEKLYEKSNTTDKEIYRLIGDHLHDIGKVYNRLGQYDNSLKSFDRALVIFRELDYKRGISGCYNNMAGVYDALKDFDKTLFYLQEALRIAEELGDKTRIATGITNIGLTYKIKGDYNKALEYLMKGLKMREELKDNKGLAYSYLGIGQLYMDKRDLTTALFFLHRALDYSKRANAKERIKESYDELATAYAQTNNYKEAYKYKTLLMQLKDSIINENSIKQAAEMSAKYESDRKEHQIALLEKEKQLQSSNIAKSKAEARNQQVQKLAFAVGFILISLLGLVLLKGYKRKQRDNENLALQKSIIEEKNKDITDSIKYAKRIQEAILPPEQVWNEILPGSFVHYKPKDILSGDFYWAERNEDVVYVAAVDCTGHGVPGALMSIVGYNLLNKAVLEQGISKPSDILDQLNKWVSITLRQTMSESSVRDGMDISLIRLDKVKNELQFAAAFNSIYHVRNGVLTELKGDKFPVGIFIDETMRTFTNKTIEVQKGDMIYLFSDGYADQFGGDKGKKFKYSQLKETILAIYNEPLGKQKEILNETFETWRGGLEQVDDVCVIGVRV